jgi:hypothetical protein
MIVVMTNNYKEDNMAYEIKNNKILHNGGKIVLVQIGRQFFKLKLERELKELSELEGILNNNDVYLLKKGD